MVDIAFEQGQFLIDEAEAQHRRRGGINLHAVSPILIGLAAPIVALNVVHPSLLERMSHLDLVLMIFVFVIAAGIFVHSVLSPGKVVAAAFDPAGRTVTLVHAGHFAIINRDIHFSDIAGFGMAVDSDLDGNISRRAELHLKNGQCYTLPEGTEESHVLSAREITGLA
jgi:hypothetical protein